MSDDGELARVRTQALVAHDLALMATATHYDLDVRRDRIRSMRALVQFFFRIIRPLECDYFIEAGAKDAQASQRALHVLPGRVVAFEANPFTYKRFEQQLTAAGVEYNHLALTDHDGPVTFNVLKNDEGEPRADGQSSLLKRTRRHDEQRGFEEVTVAGTRLDGFLADRPFERAALWMDVEGATKQVLAGAAETLARTSLMIIEVEDRRNWGEEHWLREDVVAHLLDAGLVPIARDFEYENQHNIVLVRPEDLSGNHKVRRALARFISQRTDAADKPQAQPAPRKLGDRLRRGSR